MGIQWGMQQKLIYKFHLLYSTAYSAHCDNTVHQRPDSEPCNLHFSSRKSYTLCPNKKSALVHCSSLKLSNLGSPQVTRWTGVAVRVTCCITWYAPTHLSGLFSIQTTRNEVTSAGSEVADSAASESRTGKLPSHCFSTLWEMEPN